MKNYLRMVSFVKPHWWVLSLALVCMGISAVFGSFSIGAIIPFVDNILTDRGVQLASHHALPAVVVQVIDRINSLSKQTLLNLLLIWVMSWFLVKEIFTFFQTYFMNDLSYRVVKDFRDRIYTKLLDLSMDFYSQNPTGKLVSRITFDATEVRDCLKEGLTDLLYQPIQLVVYLTVIVIVKVYFSISWLMLLASIVFLPSVIYPIIRIGKQLKKISRVTQEKMSDINILLYETISGMNIVKAFSMEEYERAKFERQNRQFYKMTMKSIARMEVIGPLTEFITLTCAAFVIWFGGKEVVTGNLSAGAFIVFLVALMSMYKPFKRLSKVYAINQKALAAINRIFEVLDAVPTVRETPGARVLAPIGSQITFDGVSFRYRTGGEDVLHEVSVAVPKGKVLAIVGQSGSGKTTLVNLLPRFFDPVSGKVLIDGIDIRQGTLRSLRDQIGIVSQETVLFNDTVSANISYGETKNVDRRRIVQAAQVANIHEVIMRLPAQYDTLVGERGASLSGGERQRIAIARAIYKNPPILILDEATSHLDTESERLVQEAIERLMQGRTVLVIAHRLSTIRHADYIIVMSKGLIVERGTHDELMGMKGIYKKLYDIQFS